MGLKKRYLAICLMLLFLLGGCVAAGDNTASDDVVKADNDNATVSVENNVVEEENLAPDDGSGSVENDDENVLGATGGQDVLGDKQTTGGTFTNLYNDFNSGSGTLIFTGDYDASSTGDVAGGRADGINIGSYTIIDGTGHHINANDLARIFIVPSGTAANHNNVVFQNIAFLNGHRTADTAYGGAIQVNQYADVTFINCTFENCHVSFRGGAIYFDQNTNGKFTNCNFTHNYLETTDYTNDYEQMGGGAIHFFGATDGVEFTDCHFNSNYVRSNYNHDRAYAGAICFEGTASNNRFVNCSFDSNFCEAIKAGGHRGHPSGGAIYFASAASEISVIECNFTNNYLRGNYSSGIDHDWITYAWGGAICFKNNVEGIIIQKSKFDNNSALSDGPACSSYGGAVCFYSGASDIHITDSDFKDNWVLAQNTRELVNGGTNNAWSRSTGATSYGGAIYFGVSKENTGNKYLDNINIYGCSFDSNHAYKGHLGESMTGAIYFEGESLSTINIHDTLFARNTAQNDYAVINFIVPVSDCELINVTFDHNSGTTAPLYFGDTVSDTNVINCTFTNNTNTKSDGVGGAMYVENAQGILIEGTTFMDNDAKSTQGSTLYIKSGNDAQVENCSFINQRITGNGAAIFWGAQEDFITHNSKFINNYASLKGAAIYFSYKPNRIEIYDSLFSHNNVQGDNGGALNIPDTTETLILKGCTFDSNEASNDGAAVYISSTALNYASIDNCTFTNNNHVNGNGGAIYWGTTAAFIVTKSTFEDNKAQKGAAVYFARTPSSIDIRDSKFISNEETSDNGGALNIPNGVTSTTIKNCTFDSNKASGDGAAIYVNSGNTNIDNSTFIGNTASGTPYVIYIVDSKTSNAISNSKFNGVEQIYVSPNAGVTFTGNNQSSSSAGSHVIKNYKGTIGLSKNNFENVIINDNGFITTQTYANVSSNATYYLDGKYYYPINATIKDDNNNYIISYTFRFATNHGDDYVAEDIITHNSTMQTTYDFYRVSGTDAGLTNLHSYNATYWVSPKLGSYTWLQDKIDKLGENGVYVLNINITFDPDYDLSPLNRYYNVINFTNGMLINKSVTIDGNGNTSISGENQARIFTIAADNVNLKNLELTNAYSAGNGGALYVKNGVDDLSISDCAFNANNVKAGGAAIYAEGNNKNIDIEKSSFNANSAYGGGAIQFNAAGSQTSNNIKIVSCNFTNNRDLSDNKGGSAVSLNQATSVELTDSSFDGNIAKANGAVMLDYCSDVVFNACNFTNNRATASAGAIYIKNSRSGASKTANITNSMFINNTANAGGAIYSACDGVNVEKSTFVNNTASNGGAIYFEGKGNVGHSEFVNNTATSNGAAIFFATDFAVDHSSFENNHADGNGTVYVNAIDTSARIVSSNFTKNSAYNGGGIYYVSNEAVPKLTIANDKFIKNTASHNGGAVYYIFSDNYYRDYDNFDGRGIYDHENTTSISFMVGSTERVFIANSYFEDNTDYRFEVSSIILNKSAHVVVKLVPDIDEQTTFMNVTLISVEDGSTFTHITDRNNFYQYLNPDSGIYEIPFNDLDENTNYTVIVKFADKAYDFKNTTTAFITGRGVMGEFEYLQSLIDKQIAKGIYTLSLNQSFYFNQWDKQEMHINTTFTLILNGVLDAGGNCRIFNITADNVVLEGITFANGNTSGRFASDNKNGGAILWLGQNGKVSNSYFRDNYAEYGGAIYYNDSAKDCSISGCTFENNNATYNGGAVDCNATQGNITGSKFYNNRAGQNGGAVFVGAHGDSGKIINSTFEGNSVNQDTGRGGAVDWYAAGEIINSTFEDNHAAFGGAVFIGKHGGNGNITNCNFTLNTATHNGGAIDWNATSGTLTDSTFKYNTADYGGAVFRGAEARNGAGEGNTFIGNHANYNGGAVDWNASAGHVKGYTFINNTAGQHGGAVFVGANSDLSSIVDSYFEGNNATGNGGAVDWYAGSGDIDNSRFINNHAQHGGAVFVGKASTNSSILNSWFESNTAEVNGGAVDCNSTGMRLENTTFISNEAQYGAALCRGANAAGGYGYNNTFKENHAFVAGAGIAWLGAVNINIDNYKFIENSADVRGGAIYVGPGSTSAVINNSYFKGNFITNHAGNGGAIDSQASNTTILSTTFEDNHAYDGGAIYFSGASGNATVFNSRFSDNHAVNDGGAINLNTSSVNVTASSFDANRAHDGGAIYVGGTGVSNYITGSVFERNNASEGNGGAINWLASAGHILDSNFTENFANYGGAVYMGGSSSASVISHVIFDGNIAKKNGGAIDWNATEGNLTHTVFKNNVADYGAALCRESQSTNGFGINNTFIANHARVSGAALAWMNAQGIKINNYTFKDNTADVSGGAIFINEGSDNCVIFNSTFEGNHVTNMSEGHHGGAIDCHATGTVINMSSFKNNEAYEGGAVYVGSNSGNTHILKSNFTENNAAENGGAIALAASTVNVNESIFKDNTAHNGGAIYVGGDGQKNDITLSTFENNRAIGGYGGAIDWVASTGDILYSNFTKNSADYGGGVYVGGHSDGSKISHVIFDGNTAEHNGGAIDWNATGGNLTYTLFKNNVADYGGALCREEHSGNGFGHNNTFIANSARISGAALAWLGAKGITIDNYSFYNNTAVVSGGSIYVGEGSDDCKVLNSIFDGGIVNHGRGGDIEWIGDDGYVYNTKFSNSLSTLGGSIYVNESSSNTKIENSSFTSCTALDKGGAIVWLGEGGEIVDVDFKYYYASHGGAIFGSGSDMLITNSTFQYGSTTDKYEDIDDYDASGATIYWVDADKLKIFNSTFLENQAHSNGGFIAAINCNDSELYNLSFRGVISLNSGGAIFWANSTNLSIELNKFTDTASAYDGGAIYLYDVDTNIKDSTFNHTQALWGLGGAIYVHADVNITNATFVECTSAKGNATAIYFETGNSTLAESRFDGANPVHIAEDAVLNMTGNNVTNSLTGSDEDYSVYNNGTLYLEKNNFDNVIINDGIITSPTNITVLNNLTYNATAGEDYPVFAVIKDDNNNSIISRKVVFTDTISGKEFNWTYRSGQMNVGLLKVEQGYYLINATDSGLKKITSVRQGALRVKVNTDLKLNVTQQNEGEHVTINATVTPKGNNDITGDVHFKISYRVGNLTFVDEFDMPVVDGSAILNLYNLSANAYSVTATYPGDDYHFECQNDTLFVVKLRESWIKIVVDNYVYGIYPNATITTNGNGTVLVSMNGRNERYNLTEVGQRVGDTYVLIVPFDTLYNPDNYSMAAVYLGDDYFDYSLNQTNFTVFKKNTTIVATPTNISFWDVEDINVTVDENATGYIKININGQEYVAEIIGGLAQFHIANLFADNYTNVEVHYGGDPRFNENTTYVNFTVGPSSNFQVNVTAHDIIYAQNATVYVNMPSMANGTATIYIDGVERGVVPVVNGVAILENIEGLAGGQHVVNATYHGGRYYSAKNSTTSTFTVKPTGDWKTDISADERPYGENTTVTITTGAYQLAGKNLTVNISGEIYTLNLTDGQCNLTLNNLTAGLHECSVSYAGDANYSAKTQKFYLYITKAQPAINLTIENGVVKANVTGKNLTGNVTFYVNGRNYTVNLSGNVAILNNLPGGNNSVVAIYNGDANHYRASSADNFTIPKRDSKVNVTANETVYGNAVEITVNVGENQTGFVKIIVNGEMYVAELNETVAKFNIVGLDVKEYEVNVTYYGDEVFSSNVNSTKFNVTMANIIAEVIGLNVTVEDNIAFAIQNITRDFNGQVEITVNGTSYVGSVKGLIEMGKLQAGRYTATVRFFGDSNYNETVMYVSFTVSRVDPQINVTIADVVYPDNASAVVNVSNNANGTIEIYEGNVLVGSGAIENGKATINLTNLPVGAKEVIVKFISSDKYNNNVSTVVVFSILKADAPISIEVNDTIVGNDTKVVVTLPGDIDANVTIEIDGKQYVPVSVENGKFVFNVAGLTAGNKTVIAIYNGNERYLFNATTANFTVSKVKSDAGSIVVNASVDNIDVGEDARIDVTGPGDYNGTAIVDVNGTKYYVNMTNGAGFVIVKNLTSGIYHVNVTLMENDKYYSAYNDTARFTVSKVNSTLTVDFNNITLGENAVFNITVSDFGNVTITIGTKSTTVGVKAGNNIIFIPDLKVGTYDVVVKYSGNYKYLENTSGVMQITVSPAAPTDGFTVTDLGNRTVIVTVPTNATGTVAIKIGENIYNETIVNGTAVFTLDKETPGIKEANVTYSGDNDHANMSMIKYVTIPKYSTNMTIDVNDSVVGNTTRIIVKVPANLTGNVTIEIDGKKYNKTADHGEVIFEIGGLSAGNKTVVATFDGNDWFVFNSTTAQFKVDKVKFSGNGSLVNVTVDDIYVGDKAIINITAPGDYNGSAVVNVGGVNYTATITDGKGFVEIAKLANGTYNVVVTLAENDKYLSYVNDTVNLTVSKRDSVVIVDFANIAVGENAVFNVTVSDFGNVTITIGSKTTVVGVKAGSNTILIPDLTVGVHDVAVAYSGNYKYLANSTDGMRIKVTRANTTPDDIKVNDTGNGTVIITVPENATGNVTIIIDGHNKTVNVTNGTAVINILNITNATPGVNNITVIYSGDENHTGVEFNTTVNIPKWASDVNVTAVTIKEGAIETITVVVTKGATGVVLVDVGSTNYYVNLTNSVGVLKVEGLKEGHYDVSVKYLGDDYYGESVDSTEFNVTEGISIDVGGSGNNTIINITVPGNNTNGTVTVIIDNTTYIITNVTNGTAIVNLTNVTPGEHNVTVIYTDGNGTNTTAYKTITISKYDVPIDIQVDNIHVGDVAQIIVTVPANATQDITIQIDGRTITNSIHDGVAVFHVAGLTAGNKTVTAYYAGDDVYAFNATSKAFNITKLGPEAYGNASLVNVSVEDIYVGDIARINITAPSDYNGSAVVNVGGVNYTATITNGVGFVEIAKLANNTYDVIVTLAENDKYYSYVNDTERFTVSKRDSQVVAGFENITVGEDVEFNITVSDFGNVTILIGGKEVTVAVKAGTNTVYVPGVAVGTYDVKVTYSGNYKYLQNSTGVMKLTVEKAPTTPDDIKVNDTGNGTIIITVPENATGNVTVIINGENKTVNVTNGTAVINILNITNATPGVNNITIIYSGDENHTGVEFNTTVNIPKWASDVNVTAINIREGAIETITVVVTKGATGVVLVDVGSNKYYVNLTDSVGVLNIEGLKEGHYDVNVKYLGDDNYTESVDSTEFNVTEGISIDVGGSGNNTIINITVPGNNTNGTVTVIIDNTTYIITNVTNGSAIVNLTNVTPGEHNVTVIYTDGNGTNTTAYKTITISKYDVPIDIQVDNIHVGDVAQIIVTIPSNATGDITIQIDGRTITNSTHDGVAVFHVAGLIAGNKTVTAYYAGDDVYAFNATSKAFNITKLGPEAYGNASLVNVTVEDIYVGDIARINITAPSDYNGSAVVNVGGANYTATITNGVGFVEIAKLANNTYDVIVTLAENDKYYSYVNDTERFTVSKRDSQVVAGFDNITVGEDVEFNITVSDFGNVTIAIGGKSVVVGVKAGENTIYVPGVAVGTYDVKVTYSGNYKYLQNSTGVMKLTVGKAPTTPDDIKVNDTGNGTIIITVPENATGNVTVIINGENKTVNVTNGTAVINIYNITNATPGVNNITIIYSGDENHTGVEVNTTVNIPKWASDVNVTAINIREGAIETITVVVTKGATGVVLVDVGSNKYYVNLTNSVGVLNIEGLKEGHYDVSVKYLGDDNYTESVDSTEFNVTEGIVIDIGGSGNNTIINITIPGNNTNGTVTVIIDNTTYIITNVTNGTAIVNLTNVTPGEHNVTVIYTDGNGTNTTAYKTITISKYDVPIDIQVGNIHVGDVAQIIVTIPANATGDVTIRIDGKTVTNSTHDGVAVFHVAGLTAGNKTVTAYYAGDDVYAFNATSKDFNITKLGPEAYGNASLVNVSVEDIYVGDIARINITAPSDYNGSAVVNVGGVNYTATITNGVGFVEIAKLANNTYDVIVTLAENDKYYSYVNDTERFTVSKRDSQVVASFENITVGEYVEFNITVSDFGNVTIEIGGKSVVVGVKAGENTVYVPGVAVGTYDVKVTYSGNYKYYENATKVMKLTVGKAPTSPDDIKVNDTGNGTIIITVPENATGNVTVIINGENKTVNVTNGTAVINIYNITNATPGVNNITIIYSGDENHTGVELNATVDIPKWESEITVVAIDIKEGGIEVINVTVTKGATGLVLIDVNDAKYYVNLTDSKATLYIKGLTEGSYNVVARYLGDKNYTGSENKTSFVVTEGISIDVGGSGNNTVINITVPGNNTNGTVTVIIDNTTYIITNVTNGTAIVNLTNVTPGEHNVTVIYTDGNGTNTTADKIITISKYDTPIDIKVENLYVGDTTKITVTVPEAVIGDITIGVGGKTYTNSTSKGVATFYVTGLTAGDKTVVAIYPGDDTYAFNATAGNFTMLKRSSQIVVSVENITAGEYTVIKVSGLPADASGFVSVDVNGTKYGINITAGEDSVSVFVNKAGTFSVVATYFNDPKYESCQNSTTFNAASVSDKVDIEIKNPTVNEVVAHIITPSDANGTATVIIDNKTVKVVPVTGGVNTIVVPDVSEGIHNVTVVYGDDDKYDGKTVSENVKVMGSIIAPKDLVRAWNSPYDYEAEFLNKDGFVLANTNVKMIVDGKEYTVKTDEKGIARLTDALLSMGKHKVTLINPVTGQQVTESVTIVARLIANKDITLDFYDGTYFTVRAIDDDGKPVGAGEVVGFKVNGVEYNGITDKNGYARLKIELNPRSYTITAQYKAYKVSNKISVEQTLKLIKKTVTIKKTVIVKKGKKLILKATLKWSSGKAIKGKKITFTFRGKTYSAKTDSKGVAKVTVKSKVTKKLKVGKSYNYYAKYITNIVKGKVKVKK